MALYLVPRSLRSRLLAEGDGELANLVLDHVRDSSIVSPSALRERIETTFNIETTARTYQTLYARYAASHAR